MAYYFSKTVDLPIQRAVDEAIAALKAHGFGVLTRIDVQSKSAPSFDLTSYSVRAIRRWYTRR